MIIDDFKISNDSPCYIIGELSANHGGDINIAKQSIKTLKNVEPMPLKFKLIHLIL